MGGCFCACIHNVRLVSLCYDNDVLNTVGPVAVRPEGLITLRVRLGFNTKSLSSHKAGRLSVCWVDQD